MAVVYSLMLTTRAASYLFGLYIVLSFQAYKKSNWDLKGYRIWNGKCVPLVSTTPHVVVWTNCLTISRCCFNGFVPPTKTIEAWATWHCLGVSYLIPSIKSKQVLHANEKGKKLQKSGWIFWMTIAHSSLSSHTHHKRVHS